MNLFKKINIERVNQFNNIKLILWFILILKLFEKENIYSNIFLEIEYRVVIYLDG